MKSIFAFLSCVIFFVACNSEPKKMEEEAPGLEETDQRIPVIIDTDANNEIDDQHAMAYLFFNDRTFNTIGVTVNATFNGGDIEGHLAEAQRVMQLCNVTNSVPLLKGANNDFEEIKDDLSQESFDGQPAVDFIIEEARKERNQKLVLIPIGKLTNIALALAKAPDIKERIKIVWLGSNYPEKGEYNQENDIPSVNFVLSQDVPFEMVTVRYGQPSGSDAVRATPQDIAEKMAGAGPNVSPVEGRHGGSFTKFGDYAYNLFTKIDLHGDPPSRALFDVVAVAILKNTSWGASKTIPAPVLVNEEWEEQPENKRKIVVWENFDDTAILEDFYSTMNSKN